MPSHIGGLDEAQMTRDYSVLRRLHDKQMRGLAVEASPLCDNPGSSLGWMRQPIGALLVDLERRAGDQGQHSNRCGHNHDGVHGNRRQRECGG